MNPVIALKVDVDTDRGTRLGVPPLAKLLHDRGLPACFLFSLGPDNTGKAIRRVFRPGFFKKVSRTNVVQLYGVRTLLNGTLFPAPHVGQRNADVLRATLDLGFEVGIHCYDHFRWQDYVLKMPLEKVRAEFGKAREEFSRVFSFPAQTAGAPGWQANANSRQIYDEANLRYASDARGTHPFFPSVGGRVFRTLEIPTTLPTLDELMGRPEFPDEAIVPHYLSLLRDDAPNVLTIHAEIEGMKKRPLFEALIEALQKRGTTFVRMDALAEKYLSARETIPVHELELGVVDGRSGLLAVQGVARSRNAAA